MGQMFDLLDRLDAIDIKPVIIYCIEQSQDDWTGLNRTQLYHGYDNIGESQNPLYKNPKYAAKKEINNPIPGLGVPDLFVTGNFYNSIKVMVNQTTWSIKTYSDGVSYAEDLEAKWPDIYGLDDENKAYFSNEIVKPKLVGELKTQLGL